MKNNLMGINIRNTGGGLRLIFFCSFAKRLIIQIYYNGSKRTSIASYA